MASRQPFKFFDWKQKLTKLGIRVNKTIKHKVLSKSRNALIISSQTSQSAQAFDTKLKNMLKKTWEIYELNLHKSNIMKEYGEIENKFIGRQYDAIVVMPKTNRDFKGYFNIGQQQFATQLQTYQTDLMKNILAYRLAHKYLTTSGVLIFSNSETDFAKVQNKGGVPLVNQPALKNILDAQISYLGVTVGDRDYTDLNSWSVIGLSQQFIKSQNEDYVVQMYGEWADGRNLPMPGSFALFKMKQQGKKGPFVQYL